jgi:hypothetical protein
MSAKANLLRLTLAAALPACCAIAWLSCLGPTELSLVISTDVKCADLDGTTVVVGHLDELESKPPTTS